MTQQWIVSVIVLAAAAYALWYWLPAGLRRRLRGVHPSLGENPGCGTCKSCRGCGDQPVAGPDDGQSVHRAVASTRGRHTN
jgi:hypothetical protein